MASKTAVHCMFRKSLRSIAGTQEVWNPTTSADTALTCTPFRQARALEVLAVLTCMSSIASNLTP
eukprot:9105436-Pyramimonas_sp.AAC.1